MAVTAFAKEMAVAVFTKKRERLTGADPGEVKWVHFHPPFPSPLLCFFLSLKYLNNI